MAEKLNHFDQHGNAVMVDVTDKNVTEREAIATGKIFVCDETYERILTGNMAKGDVLGVARVAGIMSVKHTSDLVPMCHPLPVTKCAIDFEINEAESYLIKAKGTLGYEDVLEFYYSARSFITVSELYSNKYTTILRKEKSEFIIKIFCINPSENLKQTLNGAYSSIIFSATLSTIKYYMDLIGGDEKSFRVRFDSPFNKKNLSTYLYNLDMRYFNREKNIDMLCKLINQFITEVKGNYMVFLPSFEYLGKVYEKYIDIYGNNGTIIQEENLSEEKKKEYLEQFSLKTNIVGFTVVGGMFSEGIDLPGDKLIGAIIVGVGFPKVSIENNIIQDYFEKNGFDYSYTYPGINKVLQSVGRVIRTENDKGRVLLIDNRYSSYKYKAMLPSEWDIKNYKLLN